MRKMYVCPGSCKGKVTEEDYKGGKTVCGSETCERSGQPFEEQTKSDGCCGGSDSSCDC